MASTCPKDDLRRVLQEKIVSMQGFAFTTNNPWRFKCSHDFDVFLMMFQIPNTVANQFCRNQSSTKSEYATWCLNRPANGSSTLTKDPIPGNHRIALSLDMDLLKRPGQTKRCTQKHKSMVNNSRNGEEIYLPISYQYSLTTWYFSGQSISGCLYFCWQNDISLETYWNSISDSDSNCLFSWHNAQPAALIPQLELNAAPGDI